MIVSHAGNHAARSIACQPNVVRLGSISFQPTKKICHDLASFRHDKFFHTAHFKCARHFALMAVGVDAQDTDASVWQLLTFQPIYGDPAFTFALCACVTHQEILLDFSDGNGRQRGLSDFNLHSSVLTMVGSSNPIVRRTGGNDNIPARVAPMQGSAA